MIWLMCKVDISIVNCKLSIPSLLLDVRSKNTTSKKEMCAVRNEVNLHLLFHFSSIENTWCSHLISLWVISLGCTHFDPKVNVCLLHFASKEQPPWPYDLWTGKAEPDLIPRPHKNLVQEAPSKEEESAGQHDPVNRARPGFSRWVELHLLLILTCYS